MLFNQFKLCREQDIVFIDDGKEAYNELKNSIIGHLKQKASLGITQGNEKDKIWLFDAIILDYEMPNICGLSIVKKIKEKFKAQ